MGTWLVATVLVLTVLVLIDLALTFAIIRRMRDTADVHRHGAVDLPVEGPPPGTVVPAGLLETVTGPPVDLAEITSGRGLLAFVASGCTPCHDQLAELRRRIVDAVARGHGAAVVVLSADGPDQGITEVFAGLVPVVHENGEAPVSGGLRVTAYPTYLECAGSRVSRVHSGIDSVPAGSRV